MTYTFRVKEIDSRGNVIESLHRAESKEVLAQAIRAKGHTPVKIEVEDTSSDLLEMEILPARVKSKDLAVFCKQLYTMLQAGMPLITALDVLANQSDNKTLRRTVKEMAIQVQKGDILSVSMKNFPKVFPVLLISMVEAGEMTGNLDEVLERMAEHYTKEDKINNKIKGAMVYPTILAVLTIVVVIVMLTVIMPTFVTMFESNGAALPSITQFLVNLSNNMVDYWYFYLAVVIALIISTRVLLTTYQGKRTWDLTKLNMPLIRKPIKQIVTSRFTRTLSTLLSSGIPILDALESAAGVTNNIILIESISDVTEEIRKGSSLSVLLQKVGIFPPMVISMVSIGEESGALDSMLEKTADYFDEELESALQRLVSMIEPLMIVTMAIVVGFIVVAMLLPMFEIYSTVN